MYMCMYEHMGRYFCAINLLESTLCLCVKCGTVCVQCIISVAAVVPISFRTVYRYSAPFSLRAWTMDWDC